MKPGLVLLCGLNYSVTLAAIRCKACHLPIKKNALVCEGKLDQNR